jgi:hypothetical protein
MPNGNKTYLKAGSDGDRFGQRVQYTDNNHKKRQRLQGKGRCDTDAERIRENESGLMLAFVFHGG